jgi:hypothetical protein
MNRFGFRLNRWKLRQEISAPAYTIEPEVTSYISELITPLSTAQVSRLDAFVKSLKSSFQISLLSDAFDFMYIFAGETAESSLKNLIKNAHHAEAVNSPVFSPYSGFAGNGTSSYINTGFAPSQGINYTLQNAAYGTYCNTNKAADEHIMSTRNASNNAESTLLPLRTTGNAEFKINGTSTPHNALSIGSSVGLFTVVRNGTNVFLALNNAIHTTASSPVSGLSGYPFAVLARNSGGSISQFTTREVSFAFAGKGLTEQDVVYLNNIFNQYKLSL